MLTKLLGGVLVVGACGGFGFKIAAEHLKEERVLRQLTSALDYMECELQYRSTPLPELLIKSAEEVSRPLKEVLLSIGSALAEQLAADVEGCVEISLEQYSYLPSLSFDALRQLGQNLGRFDIEGQLKGLEAVRRECRRKLEQLSDNRENRLRGYKTLGLCGGAALAILLL